MRLSKEICGIIDKAVDLGYTVNSIISGLEYQIGSVAYKPSFVQAVMEYVAGKDEVTKARKKDDGMPFIPVLRRKSNAEGLRPDADVKRDRAFRGRI